MYPNPKSFRKGDLVEITGDPRELLLFFGGNEGRVVEGGKYSSILSVPKGGTVLIDNTQLRKIKKPRAKAVG